MLILWLIGITMVLRISVPDQLVCGDYDFSIVFQGFIKFNVAIES